MLTISDALTAWLETMSGSRSAPDARSAAHRVALDLGDRALASLTPLEVQRWLSELSTEASPNRIRGYYWALRGAVRCALLGGALDRDPLSAVRCPHPTRRPEYLARCQPLTALEATRLISASSTPDIRRAQWACALLSGVRVGELSALRWCDWQTDVPLDCLVVERSWSTKRHEMGPTKTGRVRRAPVHPELRGLLVHHRSIWRRLFGRAPSHVDLIFPRWSSGNLPLPQYQPQILRAWKRDLSRACIAPRPMHASRHTFITLAVEAGAREEAIFACTHGDSSIRGVYRHWQWPSLCEAVALIPVRWIRPGVEDL